MSAASVMPASLPPQQSAYPRRQATGGAKTVPNSRLLIIGGIILVIVVATIVLLVSCNRVEGKYYFEYGISSSDGERYTLDDFRAAQNLGENVDDKDLFWLELTDSARYRIHMDGEADQTGAYKIEDGLLYLYEEDDREDIYVMAVMDENRIILTSGGITIFKK
jgi:hypothetical protein